MSKELNEFVLQFITCKSKKCAGCEADIAAIIQAVRSEFAQELIEEIQSGKNIITRLKEEVKV
jgi:hypothetical protein